MRAVFFAGVLATGVLSPARAQEVLLDQPLPAQDEPQPVFGSGLDLVNVTITVRNEQGRLVGNLKPEDFVVTEDGRPQTPVVFADP
jgi:hypothetical protein